MRDRRAKTILWLWFAGMVALCGILLGRHLLALPHPSVGDPKLAASLEKVREQKRVLVVHVLNTECRCSQRVIAHLTRSTRPVDVAEVVLLLGEDAPSEARLKARGYRVIRVTQDELTTRWHVQAAPFLAVMSGEGVLTYAGGYTTRKQGPDIQDLDIIRRARTETQEALPVFGCAVAEDLRKRLDPTGVL